MQVGLSCVLTVPGVDVAVGDNLGVIDFTVGFGERGGVGRLSFDLVWAIAENASASIAAETRVVVIRDFFVMLVHRKN